MRRLGSLLASDKTPLKRSKLRLDPVIPKEIRLVILEIPIEKCSASFLRISQRVRSKCNSLRSPVNLHVSDVKCTLLSSPNCKPVK